VELLIAFVLVALISILLFSGLRLGIRSWEGVETSAEYNAELRLARDFLVRVLSQSRPITLTLDAEPHLLFTGNGQNLEFVSPLSEQVGIPGLYILRLGLEARGERGALVLTRWLLNPDVLAGSNEIPAWQPLGGEGAASGALEDQDVAAGAFGTSILLDNVEEFEIAYFGFPEGEDPAVMVEAKGEWQATWLDRAMPPQALRIHLTTPQRVWPDLIIWLGASTPVPVAGFGKPQ
jgi:general secretion pathway protein J